VAGPEAGLQAVEATGLHRTHLFHAIRADLLRRLERTDEAAEAYQAAIERTDNDVERTFLAGRLADLR
jgi:RNA polymerase sigma-70 factor (ECF subfamily)